MAHKWVYLGNNRYQCQNCGIEVERGEIQVGSLPGCRLEAETRLEQLEIRLKELASSLNAEFAAATIQYEALEKRLKLVEGGVIK